VKHEFRLGAVHHVGVGGFFACIPAEQAMGPEQPQIPGLADRRSGRRFGHRIFRPARCAGRLTRFFQDDVDLRHLEPGQFNVDLELD